jgi:spore maturation protein CgeB
MQPGVEVLAYQTGDEIPEMVDRALKDGAFYRSVSEAGYRRILAEHTYVHRLREMIRVMRRNSASLP